MATVSFDKNIVIEEPGAIETLVELLLFSDNDVKPVDKTLASPEAMARGEEILKLCLSHLENS
ncbi:hypothetical protein [Desulfurispora thermophila]|uniref:hypothetical protein n=1 Tax=Desulfurispora thermophila TaxID=265470 RepID=UPI000369ADF4|nr:hypothetical protein [Desulfurispora thermophila]